MPRKLNSAKQMQNYVPAGNGDASGEYADNATGSNKHFKAFYKSQVNGEITGSNGNETLVKHSDTYSKIKKALDDKQEALLNNSFEDMVMAYAEKGNLIEDEANELLKLQAEAVKQHKMGEDLSTKELEEQVKKDEEAIKQQEVEEGKQMLKDVKPLDKKIEKQLKAYKTKEDYLGYLNQFEDEFDKEKLEQLNEEELKQLVIAKQNTLTKEKDYNKKFTKQLKEINEENSKVGSVWYKKVPKTYNDLVDSLEEKENWFKQWNLDELQEKLNNAQAESGKSWIQSKIDNINNGLNAIEKIKSEVLPEWEKAEQEQKVLIETKELSKEALNKFDNPNNVYSQKAKDNAHWFKTQSQSLSYFKDIQKTYDKIGDGLKYIKEYTSSYWFINEPLRKTTYSGNKGNGEKFKEYVAGMTNAIDKSVLTENMWFQRGVSKLNVNGKLIDSGDINSLVGTTFEDQGFVSCGTHKGGGFYNQKVIMNIYAPKGTKALYVAPISHSKDEDETIIQRGYSYKITKAESKDGKIYLDCEVVLGSDVKKYDSAKLEELSKKYF
jgi:hypothetical protein